VFSDISPDLLDHCRATALRNWGAHMAEFVLAAAEDLSPISESAVDILTTRSVLIYVQDRHRAFSERSHREDPRCLRTPLPLLCERID